MKIFHRIMVCKYEYIGTVLLVFQCYSRWPTASFFLFLINRRITNYKKPFFQVEFCNDYSFTFSKERISFPKKF